MNTNEKGNIGLAKVISKLTEMGYYCFLPFTDTTCVDLVIANKFMQLKRVQVKYRKKGSPDKTGIQIPFQNVVNGKRILVDRSKIDYYIVYCPDNDKVYFIDISNIPPDTTVFTLRIDKVIQSSPKIKIASDYEELKF